MWCIGVDISTPVFPEIYFLIFFNDISESDNLCCNMIGMDWDVLQWDYHVVYWGGYFHPSFPRGLFSNSLDALK